MSFICEGVIGFVGHDDVIEERDVKDGASFAKLVRLVDVRDTRIGDPTRVVVEEDDRSCVAHQRFFYDAPVVDLRRLDGADGNHLLSQRKIG